MDKEQAVRVEDDRLDLIGRCEYDLGSIDGFGTRSEAVTTTTWEILQSVPDALLVIDSTRRIVFGNGPAEQMLGYEPDQLSGLPVTQLIPEARDSEDPPLLAAFFTRPRVHVTDSVSELHLVCRNGQELPVDISLSSLETNEDRLVVARLRDRSDREAWAESLRQSAELNLAILSSLDDHIAVLDRTGTVTAVNDAWLRFACDNGADPLDSVGYGASYLDVCRRAAAEGDHVAARALAGIRAVLSGTLGSFSLDYSCDSPAKARWYRLRVFPLRCPEGGVVVSHANITSQKRLETKFQEALRDLKRLKNRLAAENLYLREEIKSTHDFEEIIGHSDALQSMLRKVEQVSGTDASVLIQGETGTGKELVARAVHHLSPRRDQPFVKVNCSALPGSLLESELFGHVRGAFTGAISHRTGRFELARNGTILLDEIGDLPLDLQAKILRVLQEGEFERLGASETIKVDVRVIAATNRYLQRAVREGRFRADLYHRLAVFPLEVPPLRERRGDIPLLVWHFITKHQNRLGKTIEAVAETTMEALIRHSWPGNIRELENYVERAIILSSGPVLRMVDFVGDSQLQESIPQDIADLQSAKRSLYLRVLGECRWRIKGKGNAAERLGLNPSTLRYQLKKMGIVRPPR
jgi:PAS domain S-box-containing protein